MRRWDIFCTVVDNFGDIGTCWRLAQQLANEHEARVRLWVDNLECFAVLCPSVSTAAVTQFVGPVEIRHWPTEFHSNISAEDVADVVIEAFACDLPDNYIAAMAQKSDSPIWINLEYLSAETWIEDCHLLTSPHPKWPLTKTFFFPGFTAKTGGLLCERDLASRRTAFESAGSTAFWSRLGMAPHGDELRISLFCYDNPALTELLQGWSEGADNVSVLATPGPATIQIANWFDKPLAPGLALQRGALTVRGLPFLTQTDYDQLLWGCDINFVRGEDSFVRAQWAQRPFLWQIYPQAENTHLVKLDAFLSRYLTDSPDTTINADVVRRCWHAWNGIGDVVAAWHGFIAQRDSLRQHAKDWANRLDRMTDLTNNLARFVHDQ